MGHILPEYERRSAVRALRVYDQPYLGLAELAQICGVKKNTACNWKSRGKTPQIDYDLAMGPVWNRKTILNWLIKGDS